MSYRVSRIVVSLVLVDEYDAISEAQPIVFSGDPAGDAASKVRTWLDELPAKLAEVEAPAEPAPAPNRAQRRAKKPE